MCIFDSRFLILDWRGGVVDRANDTLEESGRRRRGFTLIELMVSLGILLVLGAMAVAIIPSVTEGQKTIQAATQLQQWLEIAKQMAAQDRVPRGIRLLPNPGWDTNDQTSPKKWQVVSLEYLEQPEPFTLGNLSRAQVTSTEDIIFPGATKKFWPASTPLELRPVLSGDYIELAGVVYQITGVESGTTEALKVRPQTLPLITTTNYRIIRKPRPMGAEQLQMAKNIIIDLRTRMPGNPPPDKNWMPPFGQFPVPIDIMFAPDGRVLGSMAARDKIIFWVRDESLPEPEGDPTLVVLYPATGLIATYPVDLGFFIGDYVTPLGPYTFTATGKRSSQ